MTDNGVETCPENTSSHSICRINGAKLKGMMEGLMSGPWH